MNVDKIERMAGRGVLVAVFGAVAAVAIMLCVAMAFMGLDAITRIHRDAALHGGDRVRRLAVCEAQKDHWEDKLRGCARELLPKVVDQVRNEKEGTLPPDCTHPVLDRRGSPFVHRSLDSALAHSDPFHLESPVAVSRFAHNYNLVC